MARRQGQLWRSISTLLTTKSPFSSSLNHARAIAYVRRPHDAAPLAETLLHARAIAYVHRPLDAAPLAETLLHARAIAYMPRPRDAAPRAATLLHARTITYMPRPGDGAPHAVTLIPGDGIGPLVTGAVVEVMKAMHAPLYFETYEVSGRMDKVPDEVIDSIRKNKVCLKGGLATPVGGGVSSLNVQLRKELDLYASLVHCFNLPGLQTRHDNVNIVVIRENTEGEYSGLEHEVVPGVVESLKVITKFCSERIAKYAFEYAYLNNRKTVTAVHKANIMKLADGLFLESCREVAKNYPGIKYNEIIVDNCCMQLVSRPQQFDVMAASWLASEFEEKRKIPLEKEFISFLCWRMQVQTGYGYRIWNF